MYYSESTVLLADYVTQQIYNLLKQTFPFKAL